MMLSPEDSGFLPQAEIRASAGSLSQEAFVAHWGAPILWISEPPETKSGTSSSKASGTVESYRRTMLKEEDSELDPATAGYLELAGVLRKRGNNPFPNMISIGRARNNDLVVNLACMSKLQGYFRRDGQAWSLTDWGSTNGTAVGGEALTARTPLPLESGFRISFGDELYAVFLDPAELYDSLRSGVVVGQRP